MLYMIKGTCEQTLQVDGQETTIEVQFKGGGLWEGHSLTFSKGPKFTYTSPLGEEINGIISDIPVGTKLRLEVNDYPQVLVVVETDGLKLMVRKTV